MNINDTKNSVLVEKGDVTVNGTVMAMTCINCNVKVNGTVMAMSNHPVSEVVSEVKVETEAKPKPMRDMSEYWRRAYRDENDKAKKQEKQLEKLTERNSILEQANHDQAERIKELERIIEERREAEYRSVWDCKPSKVDCERLIRILDLDLFDI